MVVNRRSLLRLRLTTGEVVLYAKNASVIAGTWQIVADPQAAGGARLWNPDAAVAKLPAALAAPANYFELTFNAEAGRAYRLWMRGRAENDAWANDSVYVQFSGSVTATGVPVNRIGTTERDMGRHRGLLRLRVVRLGLAGQRVRHGRARSSGVLRGARARRPSASSSVKTASRSIRSCCRRRSI